MINQQKSLFYGEKILITDDEEIIVELASLLLKRRGFEVLTAANGAECLKQVAEHQPALVLLDYMMPVMNGLEALRNIRADFPDVYVIIFTGKGSEDVAVTAMKDGAADYIQKPFVNQSLLAQIDAVLTRRHVELENRKLVKERELLQLEINEWNKELEKRVQQKTLALEQAHHEIIQAEKMAAVGHVTAGIAHEIRNPLNSINLFAQILLGDQHINSENKNYLDKIIAEVERIDHTLVQMLAASDRDKKNIRKINLAQTLDRIIATSRPLIDAQQIDLQLDIDQNIPLLTADPLEMEQICTNLISNALYEMPTGGTLAICLFADAEKIQMSIADSGSGIPTENLHRIFEPFFTTRRKGTGFGLSVVMRIVTTYGGHIRVENKIDKGACFYVELPLFPDVHH